MGVRQAEANDVHTLAQLHVAAWQAAYRSILPNHVLDHLSAERSQATWRRRLRDPTRRNLVCEVEGELIGFVAFGPSRDDDAVRIKTGEVYGIYVHPAWWGRGCGRQLWLAAQAGLLSEGYEQVTLWVFEANAQARAFYERSGFVLDEAGLRAVERYGVVSTEVRYRRPVGTRAEAGAE
jgi:ribosomal protein S18 acetylase RimI-like enzyme